MIQAIEIKNFKTIKSKNLLLRNLNILMGLNGMGKSSLIQALLCLRQSRNLFGGRLDLNNSDYVMLGKTKDVFYQFSRNEDLVLNLIFYTGRKLELIFDYRPEADFFLAKNQQDIAGELHNILPLFNEESLFNENFQYLNANRFEPKHINPQNYSRVVSSKNLGNHGEFTAHFIEVYGNEPVVFDNLLHEKSFSIDSVTGQNIVSNTLLNQINFWMSEISPDIQVVVTPISSDYVILEYQFKQRNLGFTNKYKPENVGFGISYVLPVVVALLSAKPGELIILENPESHIHPRGQAELGKLIAKTALNDVQLIVETHSDHILNGIRVAVKENEPLKDRTSLFYFQKETTDTEQYSKITDIVFDSNGELSEYPPNMLDEWSNQLLKLL